MTNYKISKFNRKGEMVKWWTRHGESAGSVFAYEFPDRYWDGVLYSGKDDTCKAHLTTGMTILVSPAPVSDSGSVSPMILGAFWIVPAVWLLMHFAVLQVVASFGR